MPIIVHLLRNILKMEVMLQYFIFFWIWSSFAINDMQFIYLTFLILSLINFFESYQRS